MRACQKILLVLPSLVLILSFADTVHADDTVLMMATTTSTDNTGLLDYLAPYFKADTGIELRWVAVGTGKALELGKNCDVDILLVHAPEAEVRYMSDGYGVMRTQIMYNDFVIIGPREDPARVKERTVSEALHAFVTQSARFASRGDDSGTHKKEKSLWKAAGLSGPERDTWYFQTGQGMLGTIHIAAEMGAYTLADRGTFIKYESNHGGNPPLMILVAGDAALRNQYSILMVNPHRCERVKQELAGQFIEWIISSNAQRLIGDFTLLGKQLFIPNAGEQ